MAPQYAKDQPEGYSNYIKNVAIVGAGGQAGKYIVQELLALGKHNVTAITRHDSTTVIADGVTIKKVDYSDPSSLTDALRGQDVLIVTLSIMATPGSDFALYRAAADAGVPWVVPNEWGFDAQNAQLRAEAIVGEAKAKAREEIEKLGLSWVGIACGFWYEFSLAGSPDRYGFDVEKKTAIFFGDGEVPLSTSTFVQNARGAAKALALPLLAKDEGDKSVTLSQYRNDFVRVNSFLTTQKEMLEALAKATGTGKGEWKVENVEAKEYYEKAKAEMLKGDYSAFSRALYSRLFYPDAPGKLENTDNERLGLPKEDFQEATNRALEMREKGQI